MNWMRKTLFFLSLAMGIGAMAGGLGCFSNIYNPLGAPLSLLEHSPFTSYFFPGLFLFAVLGLGNLAGALALWRYPILGPLCSLALGILLCTWIIIQCWILGTIAALHIIFFALGLMQTTLSLRHLLQSGDLLYLFRELIN